LIDPVATLDFAVLLRVPRPNVAMADPRGFDGEDEREGEFRSVIALEAPDGEREGPRQLGEEREARAVVQPPIEPQHAEAGAIVQGGVLERPAARDRHVFHIDLDRLTWFRFLEQLHLAGLPLAGAP